MKILKTFAAKCTKCGRDREYMKTETDLGYVDVACSRWCACNPAEIVQGLTKQLYQELDEVRAEGSTKVDADPPEGGSV